MLLSAKPDSSEDKIGGEAVIYNEAPGEYPVPSYGFHTTKGRRPTNEDRILCQPRVTGSSNVHFFGVFDGHLGERAAQAAKDGLARKVAEGIRGISDPLQLEQRLSVAFKDFDKDFCKQADANGWKDGSTACTVLLHENKLICANAGDSKAILCRMGKPVPLSKEHKPHVPAESKRIKEAGGRIVVIDGISRINGDIACSRGFGDAPMKNCIIPDPSCLNREIKLGDDYVIIATDGLWDYVDNQKAVQICSSSGSAQLAATNLVNAALANDSMDNVGVVVIDLRSYTQSNVSQTSEKIDFNLAQKVRKIGDDLVARTDFTMIEPKVCGFLSKESGGGIMGRRWQKRWFVMHVLKNEMAYDGSVHRNNSSWAMSHFVLHYTDSEAEAKSKNPRKAQFIDPNQGATREEHLDKNGLFVFAVYEASQNEPILLAADTQRDVDIWIRKLNSEFAAAGSKPASRVGGDVMGNVRTLSLMEANSANTIRNQDGSVGMMPDGTTTRTQTGSLVATGPLQLVRTDTGGMSAVGGGWHMTHAQMAERDVQSVGMPKPGFIMTPEQASRFGVPVGSAVVR